MVLSAALTQAQREELLFRNVARLVELPTYKPNEIKPWSVDEASRFLEATKPEPLYAAFALLMQYGFRRGEVLGLRWCDIDYTGRLLHIRQQLQRVGGELRVGDLKTDAGRRDEPLTNFASEVLRTHQVTQTKIREAAGASWQGSGDAEELVFTTKSGRPVEPRNFFRSFQRILAAQGIRRITVHGIRHTNATIQKNLHVPDRDIQATLGHADVNTTRRLYEHTDIDNQRDALEKVERLFWRTAGSMRCRQLLPSSQQIVARLTAFFCGTPGRIRTADPLFRRQML